MKKTAIIFTLIIISIFITACSKEATPEEVYADAIAKYEAAEFEEAKELFSSLDGYLDSDNYYLYCDLMESIQGRYLLNSGDFYFSIIGFKVLDWMGGGDIEVLSSKEILFINDNETQEFSVFYEDSIIALKGIGGWCNGSTYKKAH